MNRATAIAIASLPEDSRAFLRTLVRLGWTPAEAIAEAWAHHADNDNSRISSPETHARVLETELRKARARATARTQFTANAVDQA